MSYSHSSRSEQLGLPEYLIPKAMLDTRDRFDANNKAHHFKERPHIQTDLAPSHVFQSNNSPAKSALLLTYESALVPFMQSQSPSFEKQPEKIPPYPVAPAFPSTDSLGEPYQERRRAETEPRNDYQQTLAPQKVHHSQNQGTNYLPDQFHAHKSQHESRQGRPNYAAQPSYPSNPGPPKSYSSTVERTQQGHYTTSNQPYGAQNGSQYSSQHGAGLLYQQSQQHQASQYGSQYASQTRSQYTGPQHIPQQPLPNMQPHPAQGSHPAPNSGNPYGQQWGHGNQLATPHMAQHGAQYGSAAHHARRKPPGSTLGTDLPEGRRVVTSPNMSNANGFGQPSPKKEVLSRTKSLSSNSLKQNLISSNTGPTSSPRTNMSGNSHTFSLSSKSRSFSSLGKLSSLSTKKFSSTTSLKNDRAVSSSTMSSQKTLAHKHSHKPAIYPAILSRVAKAFKESLVLGINMKDGLEYHDSFTGKEAVDAICHIIRTNDRNLALLLGRSLDAQKFYHDVTYNHRLRDSPNEVYTFSRIFSEMEFFPDDSNNLGTGNNSLRGSFVGNPSNTTNAPYPVSQLPGVPGSPAEGSTGSFTNLNRLNEKDSQELTGVNGVFTILTDCYSPTCNRNRLCYSIACPRRLEQQARLNMKPRGGLKRAVSRLSLHDTEKVKTLWHETVDKSVLDKLEKHEKMRQELIYELIYTERDYVKDLEFMTDFYIMPLRNPANNIIPEREREAFIRTVFGGVSDLLRLARNLSEALTARQQQQKPVVECIGDVILQYIGGFEPFIKYSGNKVFASFEHERQQQVNMKYARFLEAIEKKPESRKQDLSSFLIKGVQRPARYQLLIAGILKNTKETSPDYKNLLKAKEEIEKVLVEINVQTGESTDRHKIMVLHRLLGKQTLEERYNFKLNYNNRIIYQVTLNRKRDNEKIDVYLFEHALLMVKHKVQNKREVHKVFEKPMYLPLLFINSGYESPTFKTILQYRHDCSIVSDTGSKRRLETSPYNPVSSSQQKLQVNFLGLGNNPVHVSLFADDVTNQNQLLLQVQQQQLKLISKHDIFSLCKYETRRFTGNNRINCGVPCYGGKKLLYGTDGGVWVSTVRSISATSNERICSDPTMVISKPYVTQMEVLVEYSKILVLSDKTLYEFDLSCTDSLDHAKNTRSGKVILSHVSSFKTGVCEGRLLVCAVKSGNTRAISIVEPANPFDKNKNKYKRMDVREVSFSSEPVSISFLKTKLCIGCTKGFEILSLEGGEKEPILDEADPSLDFATQRESVTPLAIHRLDKNFLLSYSEFSFLINKNGWRTKHDWGIFWEGSPQNIALFYPYLLAFDPGFIEIRDLESCSLIRALVGENIRFLHSNEHEALYACEENGYDIIVSIDFLNLKPKSQQKPIL